MNLLKADEQLNNQNPHKRHGNALLAFHASSKDCEQLKKKVISSPDYFNKEANPKEVLIAWEMSSSDHL